MMTVMANRKSLDTSKSDPVTLADVRSQDIYVVTYNEGESGVVNHEYYTTAQGLIDWLLEKQRIYIHSVKECK